MESQTIIYQVSKTDLQNILADELAKAAEVIKAQSAQNTSHDPERLWTDRDVQKRLGVTRIALYKYRKSGKLKVTRIGNMLRYREADVREFIRVYNPRLYAENHQ